ncbi:MAG: hypothetical protein ACI35Q_04305 [Marinilabiliaceae bacterium]
MRIKEKHIKAVIAACLPIWLVISVLLAKKETRYDILAIQDVNSNSDSALCELQLFAQLPDSLPIEKYEYPYAALRYKIYRLDEEGLLKPHVKARMSYALARSYVSRFEFDCDAFFGLDDWDEILIFDGRIRKIDFIRYRIKQLEADHEKLGVPYSLYDVKSTVEEYNELRDYSWDTKYKSIQQVEEVSSKARTFYNNRRLRKLSTLDAEIKKSINGVRKSFEDYANKPIQDLQRTYKKFGCCSFQFWADNLRNEINEFYSKMVDPSGKYNEMAKSYLNSKLDKIESYISCKHRSADLYGGYIYYQ